jgi:general secretion pathway protein B
MSFILDALKKSEAERQRQAGPTLLEVRITRPRRRYPLWAAIVGVLLGVNAVALVLFWLHRPAPSPPSAAAEVTAGPASGGLTSAAPPSGAPPAAAATASGAVPPPATPAAPPAANAAAAARDAAGVTPGSAPVAAAVAPLTASESANPADDEPALAAGSAHVRAAGPDNNYANLPSISEMGGNVPGLQLDLLDYSDQPNERYALINMHRVREGDVLPEGPRVLAITRDGVALDYHGQDFLLRPGGSAQ